MENDFSTLDIVKALKIPRERLREWVDRGFISPSIPAEGHGTRAVFTLHDVYGVALFRNLLDTGFNRKVASEYVKNFIDLQKTEPPRQQAQHIIFKVSTKGEEKIVRSFSLASGKWKIDVESGALILEDKFKVDPFLNWEAIHSGENFKYNPAPAWESLHIVNFKKLCADVDRALEGL